MAKEQRKSLNHGSTRVARLARWLNEPRPKASKYTTLRLEVRVDGEWSCLHAWESTDVGQHLAENIDEMCKDYANELGAFTIARVVWWSDELEKPWTSYDLRIQPDDVGTDSGQAFSGDVQSTNIQTQRHLEFMMRQHIGGVAMALSALRELVGSQKAELLEALSENATLRRENHELRVDMSAAEQTAETALSRAEELAEEKDVQDQQNNVISMVTSAIQRSQAGASPPR
jgi:regulator of replication initiation timing